MNLVPLKMKLFLIDILANGGVWTGVITTWQQDVDYWVKLMAGVSAIILAWVTIYVRLKGKKE
jgi:hypothetical protein